VVLDSYRTVLRALLALFAVVALVGACSSGDDDDASDDTTTTTEEDSGDDEATDDSGDESDEDVCSLLDLDDLSAATGAEFVNADPDDDSCTYTNADSTAVIALNVSTLDGADAELMVEGGSSLCDEGTIVDVDFEGAEAGFACLASGIPTVGAAGEGVFAVLTGLTLEDGVSDQQILEALATILGDAIAG
jgi:hypothetical protein